MNRDQLLTAEQIAKRLAVKVSWVRSETRSGAMPHVKLGRWVRYDAADIDAWVETCKHPAAS
jgi:excisionase family DNA binding protein